MENWLVVLLPYAGVSTWETDNVFVCPAGHKEYKAVTFNPTYGYNGYLRNSSEKSESQMRLANIRSPARTCLIMDGKNAWGGANAYWYWNVAGDSASFPSPRDFVHQGKANVVFLDGHVETRASAKVPTNNLDVFWNPQGAP